MAEQGEGRLSAQTRTVLKFWRTLLYVLFSILLYLLIALLISRLAQEAYDFTYEIFGSQVMEEAPGHDVELTITQGEKTDEIARDLEEKQLVGDRRTFYIRAMLATDKKHPILPGTYQLNTSMNYQQIINVITDNAEVEE